MSDPWVVCCQILRLLNVPVFRKRDWSELWLEWIAQWVRNKQCHRQSETVGFTQPEKELSRVNTWTRFTGSPDSLECSRASVMFTLVLRLALQSLMNSMLEVGDWTHSFVKKATEACRSYNCKATFYFLAIHNLSAQLRAWNALRVKHQNRIRDVSRSNFGFWASVFAWIEDRFANQPIVQWILMFRQGNVFETFQMCFAPETLVFEAKQGGFTNVEWRTRIWVLKANE